MTRWQGYKDYFEQIKQRSTVILTEVFCYQMFALVMLVVDTIKVPLSDPVIQWNIFISSPVSLYVFHNRI